MRKPGSTSSARLLGALVAALVLAVPGIATAQDPSVDQYTPTVSGPGGDEPVNEPPVTNSDGGNPAPAGGGSGGSGGDGGSGEGAAPATVPTTPSESTSAPGTGSTVTENSSNGGGKDAGKSADEKTLEGIAAAAAAERVQADRPQAESAATELLRSDSGSDAGMGIFLWAVLGVTALWAVAMIVRRRQDQDGHPA